MPVSDIQGWPERCRVEGKTPQEGQSIVWLRKSDLERSPEFQRFQSEGMFEVLPHGFPLKGPRKRMPVLRLGVEFLRAKT